MTIQAIVAAIGGACMVLAGMLAGELLLVLLGFLVLGGSGLLIWWFIKTDQFP